MVGGDCAYWACIPSKAMLRPPEALTEAQKVEGSFSSGSPFDNNRLENVLILQGGGSSGPFGCGVFESLANNNNIKIDIVAGTSIGGINAAIIAGSKDEKHSEQMLEQFWLELSESFVDVDKITLPHSFSPYPNLWKRCWYHLVIIIITIYLATHPMNKEIILLK